MRVRGRGQKAPLVRFEDEPAGFGVNSDPGKALEKAVAKEAGFAGEREGSHAGPSWPDPLPAFEPLGTFSTSTAANRLVALVDPLLVI